MRHIFAIIAIICATAVYSSAQSVRIGEPIPSLHVSPNIEDSISVYDRDYTCLIFAHSESAPCVKAMQNFATTAQSIEKQCAIVVITNESESDREIIIERLNIDNYVLAFDNNSRTFKAFGIQYAPFVVIYRTKNSRIEWFGPIHQLNSNIFKQISKR